MPTDSGLVARRCAVGRRLQALVALDAFLHDVFGLALLPGQLDAIDAAVARVDQLHVIDEAAEKAAAAGRIRADTVALQREIFSAAAWPAAAPPSTARAQR
jgi:hypothetical protein